MFSYYYYVPKLYTEETVFSSCMGNKISVLVLHNQLIAGLVGRQVKWNSRRGAISGAPHGTPKLRFYHSWHTQRHWPRRSLAKYFIFAKKLSPLPLSPQIHCNGDVRSVCDTWSSCLIGLLVRYRTINYLKNTFQPVA